VRTNLTFELEAVSWNQQFSNGLALRSESACGPQTCKKHYSAIGENRKRPKRACCQSENNEPQPQPQTFSLKSSNKAAAEYFKSLKRNLKSLEQISYLFLISVRLLLRGSLD
jgi:hypothetical protein